MYWLSFILLMLAFLAACGGSAGTRGITNSSNAGSGSPPGQFVAVSVASGQTSTGVDITVPAPASSPAPDAEDLGVGGSTAFGTGALQNFTIPTGATRLFLGIPDAFGFNGGPGAYGDNSGNYIVSLAFSV